MTRIQLELPEERLHELERLMEQTGTTTKKDLLNDALTLYEWAVQERMAGRTIASVDEQQHRYKEVVMPSLERAVKAAYSSATR
jgi:metal-responsive CopG/Arc/MetJ family transcriptional regulator